MANANGYFAQAFYNNIIDLRVVFTTSTDTALFTFDPAPLFPGVASGASDVPFSPTEQNTATDVQTAIENVSGSTSLATITTNAHTITTSTGGSTSYIVAAPATLTEYALGQSLLVRFHTACADDPKINVDGVGSGFLKRMQQNGTLVNLDAGDVLSNHEYKLVYSGTFWVVVSPISATNEKAGTVKIVEAITESPSAAWPPSEQAALNYTRALAAPDAIFTREETTGSGGGSVSGTWSALELNTTAKSSPFITLASDQLTVVTAGTYYFETMTKFHSVVDNASPTAKSRLYNTTQTQTEVIGSGCLMSDNNTDTSIGVGEVTLSASDVLEFQGASSNTVNNGFPASESEVEIYTIIKVWKTG